MTRDEMLMALKVMSGEKNGTVLDIYLNAAEEKVKAKCYPFGGSAPVPEKYHSLLVEIACYLINKRGAEGEVSHSENGISRTYESASVPDSMLKAVIPFAAVPKGADV